MAITMVDRQLAQSHLTEVRQIPLGEDERETLVTELQRADDLEDRDYGPQST
jgi:hypothetical protein